MPGGVATESMVRRTPAGPRLRRKVIKKCWFPAGFVVRLPDGTIHFPPDSRTLWCESIHLRLDLTLSSASRQSRAPIPGPRTLPTPIEPGE
eukprot:7464532-Pyramimonas_sp.AAC.1